MTPNSKGRFSPSSLRLASWRSNSSLHCPAQWIVLRTESATSPSSASGRGQSSRQIMRSAPRSNWIWMHFSGVSLSFFRPLASTLVKWIPASLIVP